MTAEEWASLPDAREGPSKRQQRQRYSAVPDAVIEGAMLDGERLNFVDPNADGASSVAPSTSVSNLGELGEARGALLGLKLDRVSDSVTGQTVVNKSGYLTELASLKVNTETEINDIKKARLLLKSVITHNPDKAPGWIAAVRVEELDGKVETARNLLQQACQRFPTNEGIWLEAARLAPPDRVKAVLMTAVKNIPRSAKLWLATAERESDKASKAKVMRRALEYVPRDPTMWRRAIELEEPEEAKVLLYKAVECVPHCTDMWLALAKMETYEKARGILN